MALIASLAIFALEAYASLITGSLALLSDAGHVLTDASGLVVAYLALRIASRPATKEASFGFQRAEVLAAALNGFLVVGVAVFLVVRAVDRLFSPLQELDTTLVLIVALAGLVINLGVAYLLHADASQSINIEGARLNVLGDAFASVGVVVSTLLVRFTGLVIWDTLVSFLVAIIIARAAWSLLKSSAKILLETVPSHIDLRELKGRIEDNPRVLNVHDLHVWTLTPGHYSLSMHVTIIDPGNFFAITQEIEDVLLQEFALEHCTIQVEPTGDEVSDEFNPVP